jgi:hypothetical protein
MYNKQEKKVFFVSFQKKLCGCGCGCEKEREHFRSTHIIFRIFCKKILCHCHLPDLPNHLKVGQAIAICVCAGRCRWIQRVIWLAAGRWPETFIFRKKIVFYVFKSLVDLDRNSPPTDSEQLESRIERQLYFICCLVHHISQQVFVQEI